MANNPFLDIQVFSDGLGTTVISWTLDPLFPDPFPHQYALHFAPSAGAFGSNEYEIINSGENVLVLTDSVLRGISLIEDSYYRVELKTPLGTYRSDIKGPDGNVAKSNIPILRDIRRKEGLALRKDRGGTPGYLFKLRNYGPLCACHDKNTSEIVDNGACDQCLGTGFYAGYFPAVPFPILIQSSETRELQRSNAGTIDSHVFKARCYPYPEPQSKDVWVEADTFTAYEIRKFTIVSRYSFLPIAGELELRQVAQSMVSTVLKTALKTLQEPTNTVLPPLKPFGYWPGATKDMSNGITIYAPEDVPIREIK